MAVIRDESSVVSWKRLSDWFILPSDQKPKADVRWLCSQRTWIFRRSAARAAHTGTALPSSP
jgi:hypothetical protein